MSIDLLVIGASGQVGRLLGEIANREGIAWKGTSRTGAMGLERLDPTDPDAVARLCGQLQPRRIVLLAAQSSVGRSFADPEATWISNTSPAMAVCEWIRTAGRSTRLVFAASGECFGSTSRDKPATERSPFLPNTPYGASKAAAASLVRAWRAAYQLHLSVAFPFNHESRLRGDGFVFGKVMSGLARLRRGEGTPIVLGDLSVVRDWGWAPDYAHALLRMTEMPEPTDLVLATGVSVTLRSAISAMVDASGLAWEEAIADGDTQLSHHGKGDTQYADCSLARSMIGWTGSTGFPALARKLMEVPE